jgi:hypothetical protein
VQFMRNIRHRRFNIRCQIIYNNFLIF